jgi:transcriptional regulator with XRE-family HTH domain
LAVRRQPPTVRLRRLAGELRGLRAAAGLTREEVSAHTGINPATLYRLETAKVRPQRRTLIALLDRYGVADPGRRDELLALAKQVAQLEWLQEYEKVLPEHYATYISFEADARSVRNYESLFVPGLLQTEDYTRAVVAASLPHATEADIRWRVKTRAHRQGALAKDDPLRLSLVVDEAALHRQVGGRAVMAGQLRHLLEVTGRPHVTFQVLPWAAGAHPGMHGAFAVLDFPDAGDSDLVYLERLAGAMYLEKDAEVRTYTEMFERLRAAALDPAASRELLTAFLDGYS